MTADDAMPDGMPPDPFGPTTVSSHMIGAFIHEGVPTPTSGETSMLGILTAAAEGEWTLTFEITTDAVVINAISIPHAPTIIPMVVEREVFEWLHPATFLIFLRGAMNARILLNNRNNNRTQE